jgi:hypothetical protein
MNHKPIVPKQVGTPIGVTTMIDNSGVILHLSEPSGGNQDLFVSEVFREGDIRIYVLRDQEMRVVEVSILGYKAEESGNEKV